MSITPHNFNITREARTKQNGHDGLVVWFTGLSGSGKSTLANAVEMALFKSGIHTYILDGDSVRNGLSAGLSFSEEDRRENIRRVAEAAKLMMDAGLVVLAAFVSPYIEERENAKRIVGYANFVEVFVNTPIEECERRDTKGLYAKARAGEIHDFTGVDAPYESPRAADIEIDTSLVPINEAVAIILNQLSPKLKLQNE